MLCCQKLYLLDAEIHLPGWLISLTRYRSNRTLLCQSHFLRNSLQEGARYDVATSIFTLTAISFEESTWYYCFLSTSNVLGTQAPFYCK